MGDPLTELRRACARVARRARHVRINEEAVPAYAGSLPLDGRHAAVDPDVHLLNASREQLAAFWLTLDAINFGSGWFPTLRKPAGKSGYHMIVRGIRERFATAGPWSAQELKGIDASDIAAALGQDPDHELMALFALSLRDLGRHIERDCGGSFCAVAESADGSAATLVKRLAGWECFADTSSYDGVTIPFLKRAQITAADLARAGVADFSDLDRLTMFADNLVPHVLRLDGILDFERRLVARIECGELIDHDSREEVEIRAGAVHAVELIVRCRPASRAADVDQRLWLRGQEPRYKARPRHRSRCTAY